jgi:hypothetical protein
MQLYLEYSLWNVPGTVDSGDGIPVGTGVLQERHEVIAGDDTGRYEIAKRSHGEKLRSV